MATAPAAGQEAAARPRRILVTVTQALPDPLTAVELDLRISKKPVEVTRVFQPQERPVQLAVLIDDSTGPEVANSLPALAAFLRALPAGSEVMVAYLRGPSLNLVQAFTVDLEKAAAALRPPSSNPKLAITDLGQLVLDGLGHFPITPERRQQLLYVGYAVPVRDAVHDPALSRAISEAQGRGVAVWAIQVATRFAAGPWESSSEGVERLTEETGGQAFALPFPPTELEPSLQQLRPLLDRQYLVEFTPPADKNGQRVTGKLTIAVRGRKEVGLLYPQR
ncbi:MAG: hypothetical protein A3D93_04330 [Acidobacteria bacterium RIFCSPHIGHO2_12_FULL_67_30]|nr:MAG: hypothetical protein A2620_02265 [Acidobacteria bacterium RIFCSPHIGHO2_01_FULL_67_28]OFV86990.1 MAG: hypothetical protein A3D93_04330 [Acidobacteria bacterium RIFCSPHIGHO2_12_FULL_67_30]